MDRFERAVSEATADLRHNFDIRPDDCLLDRNQWIQVEGTLTALLRRAYARNHTPD